MISALHLVFAAGSAAAVIALVTLAGTGSITRRPVHRWVDRLVLLGFGAVSLGAASGLILLGDHEPSDGLHLVYGAVALAVLPIARAWAASSPARENLVVIVAAVILAGLLLGLLQTG